MAVDCLPLRQSNRAVGHHGQALPMTERLGAGRLRQMPDDIAGDGRDDLTFPGMINGKDDEDDLSAIIQLNTGRIMARLAGPPGFGPKHGSRWQCRAGEERLGIGGVL